MSSNNIMSDLLTTKEAAALLQVSRKTIWQWTVSGELNSVRVGKRWLRIPSTEIDRIKSSADLSTDNVPLLKEMKSADWHVIDDQQVPLTVRYGYSVIFQLIRVVSLQHGLDAARDMCNTILDLIERLEQRQLEKV